MVCYQLSSQPAAYWTVNYTTYLLLSLALIGLKGAGEV
jgi:hypothetical protein